MALLAYLRTCSYWLFLGFATSFLAVSLMELTPTTSLAPWIHPFVLYGALVSMLLCLSLSVTLWVCKPAEDGSPVSGISLALTLGGGLLVSGMIAAFLFFL